MVQISKKFMLRGLSAAFLIPITVFIIKLGGLYFTYLMIIVTSLMAMEWHELTRKADNNIWNLYGVLYIFIPVMSLIWLIKIEENHTVISMFILIWATDIGGYVFGKTIKGWKIAPKISPNKTWAGAVGGVVCAILAGYMYNENFISSIIISILAQFGDLLESIIKRKFKARDSGNFIPGHGGILDAVDGVIIVAPYIALIKAIEIF